MNGNKAKEAATKSGDPVHLEQYRILRNSVKSRLNTDKQKYYSSTFHDKQNTISSMWSTVYQVLGQTKNLSPVQLMVNGLAVTSPRAMANSFNDIFIKKVQDLKNGITDQIVENPINRLKRWISKRGEDIPIFNFQPITEIKLREILKNIKGKKSCGMDMIDGFSLKLAAPLIEDTLLHLVNLSLTTSHYPQYWKVSKIVPLHKKADKTNGENYRPVSNIIFISQICEKAAFEQLSGHFNDNHLLHPNNHGFWKNHNTVTALAQLQDMWLRAADRGDISAALLLDLSAAFDLVDHEILVGKLRLYGLGPSAIKWIISYLKDRTQYVQVESSLSDPKPTGTQGVPQGYILQ